MSNERPIKAPGDKPGEQASWKYESGWKNSLSPGISSDCKSLLVSFQLYTMTLLQQLMTRAQVADAEQEGGLFASDSPGANLLWQPATSTGWVCLHHSFLDESCCLQPAFLSSEVPGWTLYPVGVLSTATHFSNGLWFKRFFTDSNQVKTPMKTPYADPRGCGGF